MLGLLARVFEITPENLFSLVNKLIDLDAVNYPAYLDGQPYLITREELHTRQGHEGLEILLFDKRIGMVAAYPLNLLKTRVEILGEPFQDRNASGPKIMQRLTEKLIRIIPNEKIKVEQEKIKPTKSAGRPHNSIDVWAHHQIYDNHRDPQEVYKEWLEKPEMLDRNLQDPIGQFKRIKKPDYIKQAE